MSVLNSNLSQHPTAPTRLTKCETNVLRLVMEGNTNRTVADKLFVSVRTVEFHLASVYDKLQVHNRIQAARRALQLGIA